MGCGASKELEEARRLQHALSSHVHQIKVKRKDKGRTPSSSRGGGGGGGGDEGTAGTPSARRRSPAASSYAVSLSSPALKESAVGLLFALWLWG